ncbi:hypothetical protein [Haliangium ochraceum]|uniref:Lipoprotein n=1 Tax=Haliangium ochraceum (strain DSM 14365 / JCM 11303 / SMP-2) TaxID=502025 RepID=D0LYP0_HALO1|nr:hypothetical protein [Haliangium ochraceum]ACY17906.1 hypothetical protein Hoch_5422 [Haliangium ochraceum DSM 14365]
MRHLHILVVVLAAGVAGCGGNQNGGGGDEPTPPAGTREDPIAMAVGCPGAVSDDDGQEISSVALDGTLAAVEFGYSGGCAEHLFTACWDGSFAESEPLQANVQIFHDAGGDNCEAYITEMRYIDIAPLLDAFDESYGDASSVLIGMDGSGQQLRYPDEGE